jgi:NitT/TauT family transport system permease protein
LLGGAAIWEALGWSLRLQWLPPFLGDDRLAPVREAVILANIGVSLQGLIIGFSVSLVMGLVVGALMGRYRYVEKALDVYVHALFVCPSIVFAPIFFAIFGLSDSARIAIIVVYSMFVIVINTATAIRTVDPSLVEMARSFGCNERQIFASFVAGVFAPLVLPVFDSV